MGGSHDISIVPSITSSVLVLLCSLPALKTIFLTLATSQTKRGKFNSTEKLYEDEDGAATEETEAAFSQKSAKIFVAVTAIATFAVNVSIAVLSTLELDSESKSGKFKLAEVWMGVGIWALVLLQTGSILISRQPVESFNLGIYGIFSSIISFAAQIIQSGILSRTVSHGPDLPRTGEPNVTVLNVLRLVLLPLTVLAAVSFSTIPRRPEIFKDSTPVYPALNASALGRYTFSFANPLVKLASLKNKIKEQLEMEDLPCPDHYGRSRDLAQRWESKGRKGKLWWEVVKEYRWEFGSQWLLTLIQAFGNFAPAYCLLQILQLLEQRETGQDVTYNLWLWVFILGAITAVSSWIESWLYWISWSEIALPIRAQMSALIFQKSMRRKEIHGSSKKADSKDETNDVEAKVDEEPDQKSRQSIVNLIAVDTKRISDFGSFNNYFPGSLFKLIISLAFLISLLGWKAVGAGFLTMLVVMPINIYFSAKYSTAQGNLMTIRDIKTAVVTEALQGIRQIKFSALENAWGDKIGAIRTNELKEQRRAFQFDVMLIFCWVTSPIMLAATSLAVYAWQNGGLEASVAFSAIGVFKQLEVTLGVIPELTTDLLDAKISSERVEEFLNSPEIEDKSHQSEEAAPVVTNTPNPKNSIIFNNASIAWPSDESKEAHESGLGEIRYVLRDLNISFPAGELSVISGKTGTGKSLLLSSILGETDILGGSVHVPAPPALDSRFDHKATPDNWILPTSLAYVAQIPWIENASIKDNILFGLPYIKSRYDKTIEVCALRKDLEMLNDGESTEIGANGINLSGGQRWRVTFARALYSRAGILVLDDILSAVDAHVGREIFEKGLTGVLGVGRTRILVTHHVGLVKSKAKYLVELGDGTVAHAGMLDELEQGGVLENIISNEEPEAESQEAVAETASGEATAVNSSEGSIEGDYGEDGAALDRVESKKAVAKFVEEETKEKGSIKAKIYRDYLDSTGGIPYWIFAIFIFAGQQFLMVGRSWWLKLWTGNYDEAGVSQMMSTLFSPSYQPITNQTNSFAVPGQKAFISYNPQPISELSVHSSEDQKTLVYYLSIYVGLSLAASILGTFRYYYFYLGSLRASKILFNRLTHTVLRTPLRWIDTVPLGRILNRFTSDVMVLDSRLGIDIAMGANAVFNLLGVVAAGIIVSTTVIPLAAAILLWSLYVARRYLFAARAVKRLESVAKSPLLEQFSSALTGISTIRAFDKTQVYISRMYGKIDAHATAFYHLWLFNRWMGFRLSMIGALFAMMVSAFVVSRSDIGASLAGFALSFALDFTGSVIWTVRHGTNMELDFNAAERIIEYSNLTTETQDGNEPPAAWPTEGSLEIENLVVGYAPDLPPVLKNLSFSVQKNERIGVVGRTGAGKSSLTLAIFRFLEAREGSIRIDGLDISRIRLQDLRSRIAIIPQDPVLFSGTVRSNLDPFDRHADEELREALRRVHLIDSVDAITNNASSSAAGVVEAESPTTTPTKNINLFNDLSSPITSSGLNLSQGQRQLLCLARAIISSPKIIILDEATSAVDMSTDSLIQKTIREEFTNSTLLVIAHRLSTIADFDKVLVMDGGMVGEFGRPRELLLDEGEGTKGLFRGMVGESGERDIVRGIILGEEGKGEK